MKLVQFPERVAFVDVAQGLRNLADQIDAGEFGDAHNVAWVIDCGGSDVQIGLLGKAASPGAEAHLLLTLAAAKIVRGTLDA